MFLSYNSSSVKWEDSTNFLGLFDDMLYVKIPETQPKLLALISIINLVGSFKFIKIVI